MSPIYLSCRFSDTGPEASRLVDLLAARLGPGIASLGVGATGGPTPRSSIDAALADRAVVLALVGPAWADAPSPSGGRALDDPGDPVRLELGQALARRVPVVVLQVQGGRVPVSGRLPPDLAALPQRPTLELAHDRWDADVAALVDTVAPLLGPAARRRAAAAASPPAGADTVPAPRSPASAGPGPASRRRPVVAGIVAAAAVAAIAGWLATRDGSPGGSAPAREPPAAQDGEKPNARAAAGGTPRAGQTASGRDTASPDRSLSLPNWAITSARGCGAGELRAIGTNTITIAPAGRGVLVSQSFQGRAGAYTLSTSGLATFDAPSRTYELQSSGLWTREGARPFRSVSVLTVTASPDGLTPTGARGSQYQTDCLGE